MVALFDCIHFQLTIELLISKVHNDSNFFKKIHKKFSGKERVVDSLRKRVREESKSRVAKFVLKIVEENSEKILFEFWMSFENGVTKFEEGNW